MALISRKNRKLPTPASVVLVSKLAIRFLSLGGVIVSLVPMSEILKNVLTATFSALVGGINDVQDMFGVNVSGGGKVDVSKVDVIQDDALKTTLKMIIFFCLINTYLYY